MSEFFGVRRTSTASFSKMNLIFVRNPKSFASLLILFIACIPVFAPGQSVTHRKDAWMAQYSVDRLFHQGEYTVMTGDALGYVSRFSGSGVPVNAGSGEMDEAWPAIDGIVYCAVSDGTGGWYVGGSFSRADTVKVNNVVHLNGNGTVDRAWKPSVNGSVRAIARHGSTVYLGGFFNTVNDTPRSYAAALNTSGVLLAWNPELDGGAYAFEVVDDIIYVGGSFEQSGTQPRSHIAAFDLVNGAPTAWAPAVSHTVTSLAVHSASNSIFIAGYFTMAGGVARNKIARLQTNTNDGAATNWVADADTDGHVRSLILRDDALIAAGSFSSVNGISRNAIVQLDINQESNNVLAWDAQVANGEVESIGIVGNTLYLGGNFNSVGGSVREGLAAVDLGTGELKSWYPAPNNVVNVVACDAERVFVGGDFNGLSNKQKSNIAIFQDGVDAPMELNIDLDGGRLFAVAIAGSTMYIGGEFAAVNGQARRNLAAIDLASGAVLNWAPMVSGTGASDISSVRTMDLHGGLLYIGGQFSTISTGGIGVERSGLACLDPVTGAPTAFDPVVGNGLSSSHRVNSLAVADDKVYFGGLFTEVGGVARTGAAAVDSETGALLPWAPDVVNGTINKLAVVESNVIINGAFNGPIGGVQRHAGIAILDAISGETTEWNPQIGGTVFDFALTTDEMFVSGDFNSVGLESRNFIASFRLADGSLTSWNSDIRRTGEAIPQITALAISSGRLHVGGWFEYLGVYNRHGYAQYDLCGSSASLSAQGLILTASPGDSYQWFINGEMIAGATGQSYEIGPVEFGKYAVEVTGSGCTSRSNEYVYLVTGGEQSEGPTVVVYPNPFAESVFVRVSEPSTLEILDFSGRTILTSSIDSADRATSVDTAGLGNGSYILRINSAGRSSLLRIIKIN